MEKLITKFNGLIRGRQSEQVLKQLSKKKQEGQIRTIEEFNKRLETLIKDLTSEKLFPSTKLYEATANQETNSTQFNEMLSHVEDDLVSSFEEINQIDEVQQAQDAIVRDVLLKRIYSSLRQLEAKISFYEIMEQLDYGFTDMLFSSFQQDQEVGTPRIVNENEFLFTDPRTDKLFPPEEDCDINTEGENLGLPIVEQETFRVVSARFVNTSLATRSSHIKINSPNPELELEKEDQTSLIHIIYAPFNSAAPSINACLQMRFAKKINLTTLSIKGITSEGVTISRVEYKDYSNNYQALNIINTFSGRDINISFDAVFTDVIRVTFTHNDPKPKTLYVERPQFYYSDEQLQLAAEGKLNFENIVPSYYFTSEPARLRDFYYSPKGTLAESATSEQNILNYLDQPSILLKHTGGIQPAENEANLEPNALEYSFIIDQIAVKTSPIKQQGVFVSKPISLKYATSLTIKDLQQLPYEDSGIKYILSNNSSLSSKTLKGNIEYWIIREEYSQSNTLLKTTKFPVMPFKTSRIYHERLETTEKVNSSDTVLSIGKTMFFTTTTDGNVIVYKNGIAQIEDVNWEDVSTSTDYTPNSGDRMTLKIKIKNYNPQSIYTVSYTPLFSTSITLPSSVSAYTSGDGIKIVDLVGDLSAYVVNDSIVILNNLDNTVTSKFYLQIILRKSDNKTSTNVFLEEFGLYFNNADLNKLEVF